MRTRQKDIRYCTNCRKTTHVTAAGRGAYTCDRCGATLYPFKFMPPDMGTGKRENADEEKRRQNGDLPGLRP
jgi:ribosomal protein L37AE/L43A